MVVQFSSPCSSLTRLTSTWRESCSGDGRLRAGKRVERAVTRPWWKPGNKYLTIYSSEKKLLKEATIKYLSVKLVWSWRQKSVPCRHVFCLRHVYGGELVTWNTCTMIRWFIGNSYLYWSIDHLSMSDIENINCYRSKSPWKLVFQSSWVFLAISLGTSSPDIIRFLSLEPAGSRVRSVRSQ